jgi:hypothetical protein
VKKGTYSLSYKMKDMKMKIDTKFLDLTESICSEKGNHIFGIDEKWHTIVKPFLKKRGVIDEDIKSLRKIIQDILKAIQKKTDEAYAMEQAGWVDVVALVSNDKQHFTKAFQAFRINCGY